MLASIPLTVVGWFHAADLIGLLIDDPSAIAFGAIYLKSVTLSAPFRFVSMVGARGLAGAGTPGRRCTFV